jgi:hypothetical protein
MPPVHRPFDGMSGQIFRYLLDHGPANSVVIAQALGLNHRHVTFTMQRNKELFIRLGKVRMPGNNRAGYLWCVWED